MRYRELAFVMLSVIVLAQFAALVPAQAREQSSIGQTYALAGFDSNTSQSPSSWLSGWTFRTIHTVSAIDGAGSNYQIRVVVHYGQGTDTSDDMYCDSGCQPDFDDIRFTDDDGVTLLDYWRESFVLYDNAVFWVKIADNLNSPVSICFYFGNSTASSATDGDATFIFFDDFSGNLDKWNITDMTDYPQVHSYDLVDGQIHVHAESDEWVATSGYIIETGNSFDCSQATGIHVCSGGSWQNLYYSRPEGWIQCLAFEDGQDTGLNVRLRGDFGVTIWEYLDDMTYRQVTNPADYSSGNTRFDYFVACASKSFDLRLMSDRPGYSYSSINTLPNFNMGSFKIRMWATVQCWTGLVRADIYYDYVFMAKWVPGTIPNNTWQQTQGTSGTGYSPDIADPTTIGLALWFSLSVVIVSMPVFLAVLQRRPRFWSVGKEHRIRLEREGYHSS